MIVFPNFLKYINCLFVCLLSMYSSAQEFCSVGDDSCLILWDARSGSAPVVKVCIFPLNYLVHLFVTHYDICYCDDN